MRVAWVLNLAAELELSGEPIGRGTRQAIRKGVTFLRGAGGLIESGDAVLDPDGGSAAPGMIGLCWSPTPTALQVLARARVPALAVPPEVLRRVTSRRFSLEVGATLVGSCFVGALEPALAVIADPPPVGSAWRLKRAFGMSGRGHRVVPHGAPEPATVRWLEGAIRSGVLIEPEVEVTSEVSLHGWTSNDGSLLLGRPTSVRNDDRGAFVAVSAAADLAEPDRAALVSEAVRAGAALAAVGYQGPFGVDAFHWTDSSSIRFRARSEINARFTMAYGIGMWGIPWRERAAAVLECKLQ